MINIEYNRLLQVIKMMACLLPIPLHGTSYSLSSWSLYVYPMRASSIFSPCLILIFYSKWSIWRNERGGGKERCIRLGVLSIYQLTSGFWMVWSRTIKWLGKSERTTFPERMFLLTCFQVICKFKGVIGFS